MNVSDRSVAALLQHTATVNQPILVLRHPVTCHIRQTDGHRVEVHLDRRCAAGTVACRRPLRYLTETHHDVCAACLAHSSAPSAALDTLDTMLTLDRPRPHEQKRTGGPQQDRPRASLTGGLRLQLRMQHAFAMEPLLRTPARAAALRHFTAALRRRWDDRHHHVAASGPDLLTLVLLHPPHPAAADRHLLLAGPHARTVAAVDPAQVAALSGYGAVQLAFGDPVRAGHVAAEVLSTLLADRERFPAGRELYELAATAMNLAR